MKAIPKRQANDAVYEELLENIRNGIWKKGERLPSEYQLCETLQVSRATIRAALQRLKALGLIEIKHGKGSYVVDSSNLFAFDETALQLSLTHKAFLDMTALREAIEPKAIELAMQEHREDTLEEIRAAYHSMADAAERADLEEYSRQDCRFHLSLLLASGNDLFIQIATVFKDQYYHYFQELNKFLLREIDGKMVIDFHSGDDEDPHGKIYRALCEGSPDSAICAAEDIFRANQKRYAENLQAFQDADN